MTAHEYRLASEALVKAGWTCVGGMYPAPTAEAHNQVAWLGHFERVTERGSEHTPEIFWLSNTTIGTHTFQRAIGL